MLLKDAGVAPARLAAVSPRWLPVLPRLPTPAFRVLAARMLRIDAKARSSMADDFAAGRLTEIDTLCGEVVRLAQRLDRTAPLNERMKALVDRNLISRGVYSPSELAAALGIEGRLAFRRKDPANAAAADRARRPAARAMSEACA